MLKRIGIFYVLAGAVALLLTCGIAAAQEGIYSADEVAAAVETWVREVTADPKPQATIQRMEPYLVDQEVMGYIAHLSGGGYCLCANDPLLLPVYLYSDDGRFDPADERLLCFLEGIAQRTKDVREAVQLNDPKVSNGLIDKRRSYWQALMAGQVPPPLIDKAASADPLDVVKLNLTSAWGQSSPFNDQTPELTPGVDEHCKVGCGGVAIAQALYFWKWPVTGTGFREKDTPRLSTPDWISEPCPMDDPGISGQFAGRLEWSADGGGQLRMNGYWDFSLKGVANGQSANQVYLDALNALYARLDPDPVHYSVDFASAIYNWELMNDVCHDPPDAGDTEVAKLSFHAAVATNSRFGAWGTSSSWIHWYEAFEENFRYDTDFTRTSTSLPGHAINEINWMRPVVASGCSHTWVIDGYKLSSSQFHMVWGWGDSTPHFWQTLDETCENLDGLGIQLAPESVVRFAGGGVGGDGSPGNPYSSIADGVTMAPASTTLILEGNTSHRFSTTSALISCELILKGFNVTVGTSSGDLIHLKSDFAAIDFQSGGQIKLY